MKSNLQITVENCGRWFDDYVVTQGDKYLQVVSSATEIKPVYLKRWLRQCVKTIQLSPTNVQGLAHVGSELGKGSTETSCKKILETLQVSQEEAHTLAQALLDSLF